MITETSNNSTNNAGRLFVISGPSGVGKGTLVVAARELLPEIALSVSATTRAPRTGDIDGVNYHFKTDEEFDHLINTGGMLEWANIHGKRYGTLTEVVKEALSEGKNLILEIDTQGNDQVKEIIPETYSIFIAPPSMEELRNRLISRATEDEESINQRLSIAQQEMDTAGGYNKVIVNDNLEDAINELVETIRANSNL